MIAAWMFILSPLKAQNQLKINEFMASNLHTQLKDDYSDFVDWIELYNAGDTPVDLYGLFLTDDFNNPYKWQYPGNEVMAPKSYFIIWADGGIEDNHTSFKLSENGEQIGIFRGDGVVIDTVTYSTQLADVSSGRFPDGGDEWYYFFDPTFNGSNQQPGLRQPSKASPPVIQPASGIYNQGLEVSFTGPEGTTFRYTLDGSVPDDLSSIYHEPIRIDSATVIRARGFEESKLPGELVTRSYIIDDPSPLPVISIATPPQYLFDEEIGITVGTCVSNELDAPPPFDPAANFWNDWERPVHIEYLLPNGSIGLDQDAGIKIFGGAFGRQIQQKAFTLFARDKYGDRDFDYPLFPNKSTDEFKRFVLRCSSNDFNRTYFRDAMMNMIVVGQMDVDYQDYQPAMVYLNGEYWGLYNIREKTNHYYPESNYGIDADDVDLVENINEIAHGDGSGYLDLIQFVHTHDLSIPANYQYVSAQIDISEFMNYYLTEIYVNNQDWLHRNTKCWRQHSTNGKWRWMLYDLDWGFGGQLASIEFPFVEPTLSWALNQGDGSILIRGLIRNKDFREEFAQRFATHLNLTFNPERVHRFIDEMVQGISPVMPRQIERWGAIVSMDYWYGQVERLHQYAQERPHYIYQDLENTLELDELTHLSFEVSDSSAGWISVHDVPADKPFTEGDWFKNIPLRVEAHPNPGWRFVRWEGDYPSERYKHSFLPSGPAGLLALFEPFSPPDLVISEIHYNPSADLQGEDEFYEFIELLNWGENQIDLSGYRFSEGIDFTFASGTYIDPGEYIILATNANSYAYLDNQVFQITEGRLDNGGEGLCLKDSAGNIIDQVYYDDNWPWPPEADGRGPSLVLIDPSTDNMLPGSWKASSQAGGTPGRTGITGFDSPVNKNTTHVSVKTWPNPFSEQIHLRYTLVTGSECSFEVFNVMGRTVYQDRYHKNPGTHEIVWSPKSNPHGIYILRFRASDFNFTEKIVYAR